MSIEEEALKMCKGKHSLPLCIYCGPIAIGIKAERERCAKIALSGTEDGGCCSLPFDEWHGVCHTIIAERISDGS